MLMGHLGPLHRRTQGARRDEDPRQRAALRGQSTARERSRRARAAVRRTCRHPRGCAERQRFGVFRRRACSRSDACAFSVSAAWGRRCRRLFSRLPNGDVLIHAYGDFVTADGTRLEGRGVVPDEPIALDRGQLAGWPGSDTRGSAGLVRQRRGAQDGTEPLTAQYCAGAMASATLKAPTRASFPATPHRNIREQ